MASVPVLISGVLLDMLMEYSRGKEGGFLTTALMFDGEASYLMGQTWLIVPWSSNMRTFASRVTHPSGVVEKSGKALIYR